MFGFTFSFNLILHAALNLKFDDSEKQKKYEMVSFEEINQEINDLKVVFCLRPAYDMLGDYLSFLLVKSW